MSRRVKICKFETVLGLQGFCQRPRKVPGLKDCLKNNSFSTPWGLGSLNIRDPKARDSPRIAGSFAETVLGLSDSPRIAVTFPGLKLKLEKSKLKHVGLCVFGTVPKVHDSPSTLRLAQNPWTLLPSIKARDCPKDPESQHHGVLLFGTVPSP